MKIECLTFLLAVNSSVAVAGNFATCLLDDLPGLQSDAAAMATYQVCMKKYPGGLKGVAQGSGRGWLGYDSGAECAAKLAAKTQSQRAGTMIFTTCNRLYNEDWSDVATQPRGFVPLEQPQQLPEQQSPKTDQAPVVAGQPVTQRPSETGNSYATYKRLSDQQSPKCVIKPVMSDEDLARCKKR